MLKYREKKLYDSDCEELIHYSGKENKNRVQLLRRVAQTADKKVHSG